MWSRRFRPRRRRATESRASYARSALLAFAAFGTVSLVSVDIGRSLNLGGPVGAAIAAMLGGLIGYQSYTAMILVAWLAQRVWTGARRRHDRARDWRRRAFDSRARDCARVCGICTTVRMGGEIGASIATQLNDSINVAGGLIASRSDSSAGLR